MRDDMCEEMAPCTYAELYASLYAVESTAMSADMERKIDRAVEEFIACEGKQFSFMQIIRFRNHVWQEVSDLFEATSRRKRRCLATFRPAIRNIRNTIGNLNAQLHAVEDLLQGRPKPENSFAKMCVNDELPWSEKDVMEYRLLPFAVASNGLSQFLKEQCPPENPSRGGRTNIDAEATFYAGITKAFEMVNLPTVIKRPEHKGGSDFIRDRLCCKVEQLVTGGAPSTAKNRARRARKMGLL